MTARRKAYQFARLLNDAHAVTHPKRLPKRIANKVIGRLLGRMFLR